MSNHTPGPWELTKETLSICHFNWPIDVTTICRCPNTMMSSRDDRDLRWESNARLIAAAPELYEMLFELFDDPNVRMSIDQQKRMNAILAKATGQPAPRSPESESDPHERT